MVEIILMTSWSTKKAKGCAAKVLNEDGSSREERLIL
jgi:hypothetical protein